MWNLITLKLIGTMLISVSLGSVIARKFRLPHIVLYILTGLLLGQLELAFLDKESLRQSQSAVDIIAELGIALLLFLVGMEMSVEKIKNVGKEALICGGFQVLATAGLGFFLSRALDFSSNESFTLAIALSLSSTVIVVKLLGEKKHLNALYGKLAIGVLLVQDMVVILALTFISGIGGAGQNGDEAIVTSSIKALAGVLALFAGALFFAKKVVGKAMHWSSSSTEALLVWSLTWCFLLVSIAGAVGLSKEIGAFAAGVSLAQLRPSNSLKQRAHPLMNFFIGVFFVSLGIEIDLAGAFSFWKEGVAFFLFVIIVKSLIFVGVFKWRGFSERTSLLIALSMSQISEFSFVLMALAKTTNFAGERAVSIIAICGLCTFVLSSFTIAKNRQLYDWLASKGWLKVFGFSQKKLQGEFPRDKRRNHVIVIGMNSLGREICFKLAQNGHRVLAVDNDSKKLENLPCETLVGNADYASILEEASFAKSRLVVTTLRIEDVNTSLVYRCKKIGVPVAAHGFDSSVIPELRSLGTDYIMDSKSSWIKRLERELGSKGMALS